MSSAALVGILLGCAVMAATSVLLLDSLGPGAALTVAGVVLLLYAVRTVSGRQSDVEKARWGRSPASRRQQEVEGLSLGAVAVVLVTVGLVLSAMH